VFPPYFKLKPDMQIVMEAVIAPNMGLLVMMRNSDYAMALSLENADLGLPLLVPPPMRVNEKHGNAKRNRKRKGYYARMSCMRARTIFH
jgi:hypothetical protein